MLPRAARGIPPGVDRTARPGCGSALCARKLAGFGCARRASEGFKIGPLFADDGSAAESLFLGLAKEVGGPLMIDVPDPSFQPSATQLVLGHGMTEVFQRARMYTRGRPHVNTLRVYAITSLELG